MADTTAAPGTDPVITQQPIVADESQTKTVIGWGALSLPTPDKVKAVFKMLTFVLWIMVLAANTFLTADVKQKELVLSIAGFVTLVLQKAEDFFGIKITS